MLKEKEAIPAEAIAGPEARALVPLIAAAPIAGGFKIIFKDAKIVAKKVRIVRSEK